jgi:5-methylcytosine-specific restriction endonuclease McrA
MKDTPTIDALVAMIEARVAGAPPRSDSADTRATERLITRESAVPDRLDAAFAYCAALKAEGFERRRAESSLEDGFQNFLAYREVVRAEKAKKRQRSHKIQVLHNRRRARQKGATGAFTREEWTELKAQYGGRCAYCGLPTSRLTVDHVVPLSRGGSNYITNIRPACKPCNSRKSAKDLEVFLAQRGGRGE